MTTLQISLPISVTKKEKWYLASCHVLDVHSQGDTPQDAHAHLVEALRLFITSCFERGTLEAVLKDSGFHVADMPVSALETEEEYITVPIPLLIDQSRKDNASHYTC